MKYNVGDKVLVRSDLHVFNKYFMEDGKAGDTVVAEMMKFQGKVVTIRSANCKYKIEEDETYNWTDGMFERKVEPRKIVITVEGNATIAKVYENDSVVDTAIAKCSPEDEFDFATGAKLAFSRLASMFKFKVGDMVIGNDSADRSYSITRKGWTGKVTEIHFDYFVANGYRLDYGCFDLLKDKLLTCKVVCVRTTHKRWTVGKIYEIKDGRVTDDYGMFGQTFVSYEDFERYFKQNSVHFVRIVEGE